MVSCWPLSSHGTAGHTAFPETLPLNGFQDLASVLASSPPSLFPSLPHLVLLISEGPDSSCPQVNIIVDLTHDHEFKYLSMPKAHKFIHPDISPRLPQTPMTSSLLLLSLTTSNK